MKKLIAAGLMIISFGASAQQNKLLDNSFWQAAPDVTTVKSVIVEGNNPAQLNSNSFDPVVMAINAQAPNTTILYLLDQPGNDVKKLTHDGRTYLHWAAMRGNDEVMAYLLNKGADVNLKDSHGTTPLLFAAGGGQQNTKVYDQLIAHGDDLKKDITEEGANALLLAIVSDKDFTLTNYFISKGLSLNSVDAAGNNAFSYVARSGNIDQMKALIVKGIKPTPNAILMAAQGGGGRRGGPDIGVPVFQYLESLNIKPTFTGKSGDNALHYVVRKPNQLAVVKYFLEKGVDPNQVDESGNNALMYAASANRDTAVIALLTSRVKNINQINKKGQTALTMAIGTNSPDVSRYLIAKGASANVLDTKGNNLAYYVVENYRPQPQNGSAAPTDDFDARLALLKDKGINLAAPQKDGNTLYHIAVAKNNIALVKRLAPLGIDINAKNNEGITALHKAALIAKDDSMMKYLISIGAKKDAVTNFKETAFDLASENESLKKNNITLNFLK